jgi:hypothetical protein
MVDAHHYIYRDMDEAGEGAVAFLVPTGSLFGFVGSDVFHAHVAADCLKLCQDMSESWSWPCLVPEGSAPTCQCLERTGYAPIYEFGLASAELLPYTHHARLWTRTGPDDLFVEHKRPTSACLPAAKVDGTQQFKNELFVTRTMGGRVPAEYKVCSGCYLEYESDQITSLSFFVCPFSRDSH